MTPFLRAPLLVLLTGAAIGCHHQILVDTRAPERRVDVATQPGPPAHAPAHGHRRKHSVQPEMHFDSGLGVHVVVGQPEMYFSGGEYLRFRDGRWSVSLRLAGPWKRIKPGKLPRGLRSGHPSGKPGKKKGKGHS